MSKTGPIAVLLILLSSGISILTGVLLDHSSGAGTANYRAIYYGARCVIDRTDPYRPDDFLRVYSRESGQFPSDPHKKQLFLRAVPICVNLPTTLFLVAPLAILSWGVSHVIWLALIALSYTVAGVLAHDLAADYAPRFSLFLICLMLANSEVLFAVGNTAGIAVSLCVIAMWCFIRKRGIWIGTLFLALSLALKPHDAGLLWAFLLIAGGELRKRAAWTLGIAFAIALPSMLWISTVAPHWNQELKANLSTTSQRGDISDPGPSSISRQGSADVIISLQTVLSLFRDDPAFYNPVSLLICGSISAIILVVTIRARMGLPDAWYAIASIAALTMLPSYHRPYDAKLLLLAVPAAAMLCAEGGKAGRIAVGLNAAAVLLCGDISLAILTLLTAHLNIISMSPTEKLLTMPFLRPVPLVLLALAVFNLWIWMQRAGHDRNRPAMISRKAESALQ
jgi:hypothetical protein